ncbi:MAG TPA: ATP-binding protein [Gemmataceae bacterium]|jgi:signal transduction histidine kinase
MSWYRACKRLIGETHLERKCRFLFGMFIVLLLTGSFWLYAWKTESLAYDQIKTACRPIVNLIVQRQLALTCRPGEREAERKDDKVALEEAMDEFRAQWEKSNGQPFRWRIIKPNATRQQDIPDTITLDHINAFQKDAAKNEDSFLEQSSKHNYYYYGAVRAARSCLGCHSKLNNAEVKEGDLLAVVKIDVDTKPIIEAGFHTNRAILITTAFATTFLIMLVSYLIVRYVIVKPVKHLKEVSDAISAGELNVRSEIQTGDEFEDLSHAFNRMLRNLVSMQDRLRKVNADLDRKLDELAQANLALYESNRLKSDFLATMSHELRTPLNSILGFSDVLLSSNGLNDKQNRWVANIQSSGQQLLNLINDILDLAKIEAGKMQVRLVEFNITDVCEGMLAMFRPMAEKKNIDLRGVLAPNVPLLRQDVVKFQQILSNLLSNAIKFTPEGGRVQLKAEVDPLGAPPLGLTSSSARWGGGYLVLTVTDTGVGIAQEEQEMIFEKFRQAGNPLTRQHAGTGLGLSIVRELSKLLGGEVMLQSELGRGSTFTMRLPLQLSEEPRLEFDLAHEGIDLSKAQRVDVRLYAGGPALPTSATPTRLDAPDTQVDTPAAPTEERPSEVAEPGS